jgi:hypothetical protein
MKTATGFSTDSNTVMAIRHAMKMVEADLETKPDLLIVYTSITHDIDLIRNEINIISPDTQIHGGTSCLGVMTRKGFHSVGGTGLGVMGISNPDGNFGTGMKQIGDNPRLAGAEAISQALALAQRSGEPPALVWLNSAPGFEEETLLGIQDVIGASVPIAGGSTGDNTIEGNWKQFNREEVFSDGVIVTAMYPSEGVCMSFHSGYSPSDKTGIVTKVDGRTLYEIDGKPAAEVYNKWTNGAVDEFMNGGNVLAATSLYPIGRVAGKMGEIDYHRLSHPETVTADGALTLFSVMEKGDEITLMTGTRENLVSRAGIVAKAALEIGRTSKEKICGGLIVYCAGCMLTVQDEMDRVAQEITNEIDASFLGVFTFGEQGCFYSGENYHGNLMISVVLFKKEK